MEQALGVQGAADALARHGLYRKPSQRADQRPLVDERGERNPSALEGGESGGRLQLLGG